MNITSLKHWAFFSSPLLLVLLSLWLGFDSEQDIALFFKEYMITHPLLTSVLTIITNWGNHLFHIGYAVILIQALRQGDFQTQRAIFILIGMQIIVAVLCVHFIKRTTGRPRPLKDIFWKPLTNEGAYHSLPSGHTTEVIGWTLPLVLRRHSTLLTLILGIFVAVLGFSRIYLNWHHPTDVFFGWILGSFTGIATSLIIDSNLFQKRL